jgi:hypothetical protein
MHDVKNVNSPAKEMLDENINCMYYQLDLFDQFSFSFSFLVENVKIQQKGFFFQIKIFVDRLRNNRKGFYTSHTEKERK